MLKGILGPEDDPEELREFAKYLGYNHVDLDRRLVDDGPNEYEAGMINRSPRYINTFVVMYGNDEDYDDCSPVQTIAYGNNASNEIFEDINEDDFPWEVADVMADTGMPEPLKTLASSEEQACISWIMPEIFQTGSDHITRPIDLGTYGMMSYVHTKTHDSSDLYRTDKTGKTERAFFQYALTSYVRPTLTKLVRDLPLCTPLRVIDFIEKMPTDGIMSTRSVCKLGQIVHGCKNTLGPLEEFPGAKRVPLPNEREKVERGSDCSPQDLSQLSRSK